MDKIYNRAKDVHVAEYIFYVKEYSDGYLYKDLNCTEKVTKDEAYDAFMNGLVIKVKNVNDNENYPEVLTADGYRIVDEYMKMFSCINDINKQFCSKEKPFATLTVSAEISTETLLGKAVSDLQTDIEIENNQITGTLKYVSGYTGFSSNVDEQAGNYLALAFDSNTFGGEELDNITVELLGGHSGPVELDSDMNIVLMISDKDVQQIKVVATSTSGDKIVKVYGLAGLTCEASA